MLQTHLYNIDESIFIKKEKYSENIIIAQYNK